MIKGRKGTPYFCKVTYDETLAWLYEQLPMYQHIGAAAYKKDLTNINKLCNVLHHPQEKFATIHIGGTNGKGSVSNMLASILAEAGYPTGLYTSPHLLDFRERIRLNGELCTKEFVVNFTKRLKKDIEEIQPSFFEITVAMAFAYFAEMQADIAVIEVGLGGRLDSTNIIRPLVSAITNISYDHQNMLGNTLQEIAFEKAGIIKDHIPVVIGELQPETFPVFAEQAKKKQAPLFSASENVEVELLAKSLTDIEMNISYLQQLTYPSVHLDLPGNYQLKNVKTVIQVIEVLRNRDLDISDEAVYEGLANVRRNTGFSGRWQVLQANPLIICDCAHNSGGLHELFQQVKELKHNTLHIVTGMVNDKDPHLSLSEYPQNATYYFCKPAIPRGLDTEKLKEIASGYGLSGAAYGSVEEALRTAISIAGKDDLILICGSIFVAAEALEKTGSLTVKNSAQE